MPRSIPVIHWLLLVVMLGGARVARRMYCEYQRGDHGRPVRSTDSAHRRPSLMVRPWDRVETVLRLLESSADAEFRPVGILDASGSHIRMKLPGVPIFVSTDAQEEEVKQMEAKRMRPTAIIITES